MTPQTVLACTALACFILYLNRRNRQPIDDEPPYFDALDLADAVRELESIMEQLETADRLTTDIAACSPGQLHRFFRAEWLSSDGRNRAIDLCARGQDRTTRGLAAAARAERDRLNQSAIDQIRAIARALDAANPEQATILAPLPADLTADEKTAGQSGKNSGQNDSPAHIWGSD